MSCNLNVLKEDALTGVMIELMWSLSSPLNQSRNSPLNHRGVLGKVNLTKRTVMHFYFSI